MDNFTNSAAAGPVEQTRMGLTPLAQISSPDKWLCLSEQSLVWIVTPN